MMLPQIPALSQRVNNLACPSAAEPSYREEIDAEHDVGRRFARVDDVENEDIMILCLECDCSYV